MAFTQWYFSALVLVLSVIHSSKCEDLIVTTTLGKIEGKQVDSILPNEKYYAFLGIPYAKPPVGELRFMPTKPHEGWDDILNCKKPQKACAQFYVPHRDIEYKKHGFYGDEDCLYLNVFTPKVSTNEDLNFPVIVYFFNDNLKTSSNFTKEYGPDFFMKEDVIIVTINHRLGALGFLSYEDDLLPGNNGLRDVIMGLEWVRDNIKNFGGNPAKVTLMGSQGGAVIVDILLQVPKAKGLFSGAILQSGTALNSMYFGGEGKKRAKELGDYLETISSSSSSLLKGLAALHAMNITEGEIMSVHADEARSVQRGIPAFIPVVEHDHPDAIIRKLPEDEPIDIEVPVMIGSTSNEGIEYCERYLRKPQFLTFADRDFLLLFPIRTNYHFKINDDVYTDAVKELKDFYLEEGYVRVSKPGEYITYMGDIFQNYPIDYAVRTYAKHSKAPVYYYNFDYSGDFNYNKNTILKSSLNTDGTWGATSTDDLCYLFVCKQIKNLYVKALQDDDSEELSVLRKMVKLWTDFAKTGNPTPQADEVTWTPATAENREVLVISDELEMKSNLNAERFQFLDDFIARHRERAVDGVIRDVKDEL